MCIYSERLGKNARNPVEKYPKEACIVSLFARCFEYSGPSGNCTIVSRSRGSHSTKADDRSCIYNWKWTFHTVYTITVSPNYYFSPHFFYFFFFWSHVAMKYSCASGAFSLSSLIFNEEKLFLSDLFVYI